MEKIERVNNKLILGDGETTGHQHTIRSERAEMFRINSDDRMLRLPSETPLRHEKGDAPAEHRDIILPIGEPCVTTKRQASREGWAPVVD